MHIVIHHRYTRAIILTGYYQSLTDAVTTHGADLRGADLHGADLRGVDWRETHLYGADLHEADLRGADLHGSDLRDGDLRGTNLRGTDLSGATLRGADLRGADMRGVGLRGTDLHGANLDGADLGGADLREAGLRGAGLRGAEGINPYLTTPLLILLDQLPGTRLRAYKLVDRYFAGPVNGGIKYKIGKLAEVRDANTDVNVLCAAGINVATLDWCMREWREGDRILIVEFLLEDIACVPTATDGKIRLFRCTPVGEKDLMAIGLLREESPERE